MFFIFFIFFFSHCKYHNHGLLIFPKKSLGIFPKAIQKKPGLEMTKNSNVCSKIFRQSIDFKVPCILKSVFQVSPIVLLPGGILFNLAVNSGNTIKQLTKIPKRERIDLNTSKHMTQQLIKGFQSNI